MRAAPLGSSMPRQASFNSRRCKDTAGRLIGRSSASSPTVRPPEPSSSTMARRLESPRASNGSPLKGATDIGRKRNKNATVDRKPRWFRTALRANPDTIWAVLTDAANYSRWDSGVERVEGRIAPGETIKVFVKVNPGRAFPVKVIEFEPGQRMV